LSIADLSHCRLYGILDLAYINPDNLERVAREMIAGGIDAIQLRAKKHSIAEITRFAAALHSLTRDAAIPLIINDHAEIAREIRAEGVHVGQDDLGIVQAREIIGSDCIVGRSTHSIAQARGAASEGADYIGFGPLFTTPTKPDYVPIGLRDIAVVHPQVKIPIFCIGGIKLHNLPEVIAAGARRVVIVSGLLQAPDIAEYARSAKVLLNPKSEIGNQE